MKYIVQIGAERVEVELMGDEVRLAGTQAALRARATEVPGTPVRLLTVGESVHPVVVRPNGGRGRYVLSLGGHRYEVEALDERTRTIRDLSARNRVASGPAPLVAPMPGLVVRVNVAEGDQVAAGEGLVVMEAMKMENELRAPSAGRVRRLLAEPGTAVEKGAVLVELE